MLTYDRQITITFGENRKSMNWKPQTLSLGELYEKLKTPVRGAETMGAYLALKKPQQDALKDVGGYVAGTLSGPRRKRNAVAGRDIVTLDLDNIPAGQKDGVLRRVGSLGCGYCVYSTRKHHPASPRLRVLLPLDRTATADEYEPIARKAAALIGLQFADPSTFEASRLMYWPSVCADGEYVFVFADSPFMSVDGMLAQYDDWRDVTQWPQVPNAPAHMPRLAAKQGDPETKKGVVGAFCRTYDVYRVLSELLPGVYAAAENDATRFTYCDGSTTGGAITYDSGKFLYSHHATDPCGGQLVNAFDLARIHLYGDKDDADAVKPDTPINRLPSFAAMRELALADADVAGLLAKERISALSDFAGLGETQTNAGANADADTDLDWAQGLKLNANTGAIMPTRQNIRLVLENDPLLKGKFALNEFAERGEVLGAVPWPRRRGKRFWGDGDNEGLYDYLETRYGITGTRAIDGALCLHSTKHAFNEVSDYLNGLVWDGTARLDTLFVDYLGAKDDAYTRAVARKSLIAAVARALNPGCKHDAMVIISGRQGLGKSTFLDKLGRGKWYTDSLRTFEGKDAFEIIQGAWLVELGELDAFKRSDIERVKHFVSARVDRFRAAYGRLAEDMPRKCVFFGTTNSREYLTDLTGARRFWSVDAGETPPTKNIWKDLDGETDQIWAEAVARWRTGEETHLTGELEEAAKDQQEAHREISARESLIVDFLEKPVPIDWNKYPLDQRLTYWHGGAAPTETVPRDRVCALEIWCEAFGKQKGDCTNRDTREINAILASLPGWKRGGQNRRYGYGGICRGYERV